MKDQKIIFTEPGIISEPNKALLSQAGYVVVETSDLSKIKILNDIDNLSENDLLSSAMATISQSTSDVLKSRFADNILNKALKKQLIKDKQ